MWFVNKLYYLEADGERSNYIEIPFCSSFQYSNSYEETMFKAILVNSENKSTKELCVNGFSDLIIRLRMLGAYGYAVKISSISGHDRYRYHIVVAVSKQAFNFLNYIDSVKLVPLTSCVSDVTHVRIDSCEAVQSLRRKSDIANIRLNNFVQVTDLVDEHGSILLGCLVKGGGSPSYEMREVSCTLFDAICLSQNSCKSDGFYLPAVVEHKNGDQDYSYVCKITASNLEKAKSMVARSRTLRPKLLESIWPFCK